MRRIAVAVALVAALLVGVRAFTPDRLTAATAEVPELRSRPADTELADGYRHLVVHSDAGTPQGVEATPMGDGDYQVRTKLSDEQVAALPGIAAISHDVWADPYAADPDLGKAWGLENDGRVAGGWPGSADADIDATSAWDRTRGEGVVVAVIDEGVDRTHPELAGRMWRNADEVCGNAVDDDRNGYVDDCDGWDFARNDNTTYDLDADSTHGTHIAGTIAAESDNGTGFAGVAPRATIMPLKVGDSGSFSLSAAAAAVNYAVDNGAKVINASWGTSGVSRAQLPWLEAAVERARQAGVLIVAAAGNDGRDIDASPSFPASFPEDNVITVGASTNADAAAYFSNYGATSVDVYAPGWFIWSTLPGGTYGTMSGTSMAAPHVAGAAALAMAADPSASVTTIKGNLLASVDRQPAFAGRSVSGGRLNAAAAVGESDQPVTFHFDGFAGLTDGAAAEWQVTATADDTLHPARLELGLVTEESGDVYGVSGLPLTVDGAALTTDDDGWVRSAVGSGVDSGQAFAVDATLPAGQYVLVARLVDDQGAPVAPAQALWFAVGGAASEVPAVPTTPPVSEPPPVEQTPGGGYQPAPLPDDGQPVPTPDPTPAPCSNCGQPAPTTPVFVPPPASTPTTPSSPATTVPVTTTTTVRPVTTTTVRPVTTTTAAPAQTTTTVHSSTPTTSPTSTTVRPVTTTTTAHSATTTTAPRSTTTTTVATPAPSNPSPAPSTPSFGIGSVSPSSGARTGGSTVVIGGTGFTSASVVRFGGSVAQVSVAWPTMLLVRTPAHTAGTVDVTVTSGSTTVTLAGGYTFLADGASPSTPSTPSTPSSPAPTTTTTTVRISTTTTAAVPVTSTTTSTTAAPTTTTTAHVAGPIDARGLHLKPLPSGHPLATVAASTWPSRRCTSGSCAGSPLA
ncbi:MAG: Subtilase family protease [Actinomycetia bacterium]|nr:Subtilase family protease [Actinomycetes bacterium]